MTDLSPERLSELYRLMLLNRLLEERLVHLYRQGKIVGGLFRSLGQEATSVGTAFALEEGDLLTPLIRNLGSLLTRGIPPFDLFAQYMARAASPTKGKEAHHNVTDVARGVYAPIAMLGTAIPVMAGMLLAERIRGNRTVGMTYIGDGGSSVGAFHEGLNFAAVQKLPLVLVVEHNAWAYSTPSEKQCAARTLADKAPGYGIAGEVVDGNDALAVFEAARRAVDRARRGDGPTLLECKTYRLKGHAEHDAQHYVSPEELSEWKARDPLARFERVLDERRVLPPEARERMRDAIARQLDADLAAAEASPPPEAHTAFEGVYASAAEEP
jgi:TPP-dependent pyruvate/acetoin dehydrogenase alpha subunit